MLVYKGRELCTLVDFNHVHPGAQTKPFQMKEQNVLDLDSFLLFLCEFNPVKVQTMAMDGNWDLALGDSESCY